MFRTHLFRTYLRRIGTLGALFVLLSGSCLHAQVPIVEEPNYTPTLTFDIAVVRLAPPPDVNSHVSVSSLPHSSRFEATNLPVKTLLQIAYGFDAPVVGAPDWVASTTFNILAHSDEAADAKLAKITDNEVRLEKRNAIRVLLAERMGLKTHLETRDTAVYNLVVGKAGVKMQAAPRPPAPDNGEPPPPLPPADLVAHGSQHGLEFVGSHAPMTAITAALSFEVEAPVADKTALTGAYNYTLQFGRDWSANDAEGWPSIFTAVQEQLGLKLEAVYKGVPNLVVDHINKPTEN